MTMRRLAGLAAAFGFAVGLVLAWLWGSSR